MSWISKFYSDVTDYYNYSDLNHFSKSLFSSFKAEILKTQTSVLNKQIKTNSYSVSVRKSSLNIRWLNDDYYLFPHKRSENGNNVINIIFRILFSYFIVSGCSKNDKKILTRHSLLMKTSLNLWRSRSDGQIWGNFTKRKQPETGSLLSDDAGRIPSPWRREAERREWCGEGAGLLTSPAKQSFYYNVHTRG